MSWLIRTILFINVFLGTFLWSCGLPSANDSVFCLNCYRLLFDTPNVTFIHELLVIYIIMIFCLYRFCSDAFFDTYPYKVPHINHSNGILTHYWFILGAALSSALFLIFMHFAAAFRDQMPPLGFEILLLLHSLLLTTLFYITMLHDIIFNSGCIHADLDFLYNEAEELENYLGRCVIFSILCLLLWFCYTTLSAWPF